MEPATTQRSPSLVRPQPAQNDHHRLEDEMKDPNLEQLIDVGTTILSQALDFVNDSITSDEQLTVHSQYMPGSTIGKHLRHARDHFTLLLDCVTRPQPYVLSYDVRSRNTPMESSRKDARVAIESAIAQVKEVVPGVPLDAPITLNAITPYSQTMQTTFGRELWFAGLHAVHHWSMIRVIAGEQGIQLDKSFGFAPSTLVHQGKEASLGKAKI
ncbi:hypothetical protein V8E52_003436 [Russula decolorans]